MFPSSKRFIKFRWLPFSRLKAGARPCKTGATHSASCHSSAVINGPATQHQTSVLPVDPSTRADGSQLADIFVGRQKKKTTGEMCIRRIKKNYKFPCKMGNSPVLFRACRPCGGFSWRTHVPCLFSEPAVLHRKHLGQ